MPDLEKIPIIANPLDWKARVPSQSLLLKNIEAAVDNQVTNIVIDLMNEYNNLRTLQYQNVNDINK